MPSPKTPTKYEGPNVYTGTVVIRNRRPTLADYRQPETGKNYEIACIWEVGVDPSTGSYGELWMLQKIVANQGYWIMVSSGAIPPSGPVLSLSDTADTLVFPEVAGNIGNIQLEGSAGITITSDALNHKLVFALAGGGTAIDQIQVQQLTAPGVNPVDPTGLGLMTVNGAVVAAHAVPLETRTRALNAWNIEVQVASEQAASSINNAGVASFSDAQFDVDASGYVTLIGSTGPAATKFDVQSATVPGVDPVTPTALGVVTVNGATVAAHGVPLESHTRALNAYNLEVQLASAQVAPDATDAGVASFNAAQFDVDVVGYVSLIGSTGPAATKFDVQSATGPGVDPVTPSVTGTVTVNGAVVAAHSVPLETHTRALNTFNIEAQVASLVAPTPVNTNSVGLACFNTNQFDLDATSGMVSIKGGTGASVLTTTGDDAVAVGPSGTGTINIIGNTVANATHAKPVFVVNSAANTERIDVQLAIDSASSVANNAGIASFNSSDFDVDANGYVSLVGTNQVVGISNLGITYNAGTGLFSVTAADGSALSASNPGYVSLPSKAVPGTIITTAITANQTFTDDNGASTIIGNTFGLPSGTAYTAQDIPFLIYAILNSAENAVVFAITRIPWFNTSPVAGNLAKTGSAVATSDMTMFLFGNPTVADYASQPTMVIGYFRMKMSAADDWTVQTLNLTDGMNDSWLSIGWVVALGGFGAAASSGFLANGGTAPIFGTYNITTYFLERACVQVFIQYADVGVAGTDGAGAVSSLIALPFITPDNVGRNMGNIYFVGSYTGQAGLLETGNTNAGLYKSIAAAMTPLLNSDITGSPNRKVLGQIRYYPN